MNKYPKRLIEVDLPIKQISKNARKEKSVKYGHISPLHPWWARKPLASCRAVICASSWFDPDDEMCPKPFLEFARITMKGWAKNNINLVEEDSYKYFIKYQKHPELLNDNSELRRALLSFIADFSNLTNSRNAEYLRVSRALTYSAFKSYSDTGGGKLVFDPFAGGGAIPLEALRIGLDSFSSDLNPVAVLLNKVILEYIPKYGDRLSKELKEMSKWVKNQVEEEISIFYPKEIDNITPIAYLWARTVNCEGPGCGIEIPLMSKMWLAQKGNNKTALELVPDSKNKIINIKLLNNPKNKSISDGTVRRGSATCPLCGYTTPATNVRKQFEGRKGGANDARLLAIVSTKKGEKGRYFRLPQGFDFKAISSARKALQSLKNAHSNGISLIPNEPLPYLRSIFNINLLDVKTWGDLYTDRQALALAYLSQTVKKSARKMMSKGVDEGLANAIQTILALAVDRSAENLTSICRWNPHGPKLQGTFGRQALPIIWDFCETQPFSGSVGDWDSIIKNFLGVYDSIKCIDKQGTTILSSATEHPLPDNSAQLLVTDPPYYDMVPYADLSDFFYVWLRRTVGDIHKELMAKDLTPKKLETVQLAERNPIYGYKTKENYEKLMAKAMKESHRIIHKEGIGVVFFAHKGTSVWESQLTSMTDSGWIITASWPIDTEMGTRLRAMNSAVLASSIVLVCRPRKAFNDTLQDDNIGDWRDVLQELPGCIHRWMPRLAEEGIIGADAIFACLGPALEIYSRYSSVEKVSGEKVNLKEYLEQVWAAVAREALNMIFEGADASGFEEDARLTAMWLWTLRTTTDNDEGEIVNIVGYDLEYDAARKIAQGLGAHLDTLGHLVKIKGNTATLLSAGARTRYLFGKDAGEAPKGRNRKKSKQQQFDFMGELKEMEEDSGDWAGDLSGRAGSTVLDQLHQSMILFGAGRGEALKRFLVEDGIGQNPLYWRLAQALSALYPAGTDEKRWVDGVLARKKGLGF